MEKRELERRDEIHRRGKGRELGQRERDRQRGKGREGEMCPKRNRWRSVLRGIGGRESRKERDRERERRGRGRARENEDRGRGRGRGGTERAQERGRAERDER